MRGIVVGVSASPAGGAALDWGLHQAAARGVPLVAVRAWDIASHGPYYSVGSALRSSSPEFELTEVQIAQDALEQALKRVPEAEGAEVTAVATRGPRLDVLVAAAKQAELLVVGSRGVGALSRVVKLGSLTSSVLQHAPGNVAIIPDVPKESADPSADPPARIVVGVDGSEASQRALAWAVSQARLTNATLVPLSVMSAGDHSHRNTAMASLRAAAEAAGSEVPRSVPVQPEVRTGQPARALIAAAAEAALLVIGPTGRGGLASMLLGSTTSQVVGQATRPVVVVRSA